MEPLESKQLVNEGGIAQAHAKNAALQVDAAFNTLMVYMMSKATPEATKASAVDRLTALLNLTRAQRGMPELVEKLKSE